MVFSILLTGERYTCNTKESGTAKGRAFPLIIMEGTLDAPEELHLKAEMDVLCTFKGNLIEATLGLLASYYVFTNNYPP